MLSSLYQPVYQPKRISSKPKTRAKRLEELIGNTPLLDLSETVAAHGLPETVKLYAKAEWFNPGGSVKDRPALNIIRTAIQDGLLNHDTTLLDATSGNTGIAYAMIGAAFGYRIKLALPDSVSPERKKILRAYGADLIFTDPEQGADGAIREVHRLKETDPTVFHADQYNNPANWKAHYKTTANEIWQQTNGTLTHFIVGMGTSGTFMGNTRRLRELNPAIRFVSISPDIAQNRIEGIKHMETEINPGIYDPTLADETMTVSTEAAQAMARELARTEGLFVGVSAGAAVTTAVRYAQENNLQKAVIVTVLPDNGFKYLSDPFWNEA